MTTLSKVEVFADHICLKVAGDYAAESLAELGDLVARESEQHQRNKVLLDLRSVQGLISNMDRFAAGVQSAQVWNRSLRTAVLLRPENMSRFFEQTAHSRGVQTLVVASLDEAHSWLRV